MRLSDLKPGQTGVITKILGHGAFRKRVMEMGFVRGREVSVILNAPLQDPVKYALMGYEVSLRRAEANLVEVELLEDWNASATHADNACDIKECDTCDTGEKRLRKDKIINIALIGNPNCGKTSLFNMVSGAHEHVGNYAGVTVGAKEGSLKYKGYRLNIVDLPGTYSLSAYSPEELYVMRYLREETPDVIVNVIVASNLERNLYLTTELIDMNLPMVIDLNMYDELQKGNAKLDYKSLGKMLGVPFVPTIASTGWGIDKLLDTVIEVYEMKNPDTRHIHVSMNPEIEQAVSGLNQEFKPDHTVTEHFSPRFLAIKFMERDPEIENMLKDNANYPRWAAMRDKEDARIQEQLNEDVTSAISADKYGFIQGALRETMEGSLDKEEKSTKIIDAFVTNKLFGFPLFLMIMFVIFWATFFIGQYPMDWIQAGVDWLSALTADYMPDGILKDLVADGIIGGVGGVIVFLPNILILYFCISFMEDTGYMARAAFIMDKIMHRIGLHGKSFIPLLMGFGCNVPAILATRSIESRSSRLITILINPFMSCSARLPIYVLFIGTFFYGHAALVFMCLYLLGIAVAVVTARLLRKVLFKKDETPFVMELPPYRIPTWNAMLRHTWGKGVQYLRKMGGIILFASIVVWALNYFPRHDGVQHSADDSSISLERDSFLEAAGKFINPVMEPLGFSWRASVAALAGVPAKEIVVSTLGVLYTDSEAVDDVSLGHRLTAAGPGGSAPDFTPAVALSFLIFILLYCPCMATVTAIVKETGSWRWGAFSVIYNTAVAWLIAFIVYRIALLI